MKRPRKSPGAPPKNAARAHYDQLMKQGMGNSEACRIVGIRRSPGTRWRHGHTVVLKSGDIKKYAPISHRRPAAISAGLLSESERITIADLLHARRSIRAIALELGRSPSTVSREIRRNIHEAWESPSADGAAQCRAQTEPSTDGEDRRQPGAERVRAQTPETTLEPPPDQQPATG